MPEAPTQSPYILDALLWVLPSDVNPVNALRFGSLKPRGALAGNIVTDRREINHYLIQFYHLVGVLGDGFAVGDEQDGLFSVITAVQVL